MCYLLCIPMSYQIVFVFSFHVLQEKRGGVVCNSSGLLFRSVVCLVGSARQRRLCKLFVYLEPACCV